MTSFIPKPLSAVFVALGVALLLQPSDVYAQGKAASVPLQDDAAVMRWSFEGYGYGEMVIAAVIAPVDGKTAVCGAYAITKRLSAGAKRSQLQTKARGRTSVWVNGTRVLDGMRRLKRVSPDKLVAGTPAKCTVTGLDWNPAYSNDDIELRAPEFKSF